MELPSEDDYKIKIEKNKGWNFFVNAGDLTAVNCAKSFIFSSTVLTLYASYLTSSAALIGLIPAIQQVGYLIPQLLFAHRAESLSRKLPFVARISTMERLPYLFIALAIFLWPGAPKWLAYIVLAVCMATATGSAGLVTPAWKAMLGKLIDPNRRGLLFSLGFGIGGFLGIGGAFLAGYILDTFEYPFSYGLCFLLSFLFQAISWLFLILNREPPKKSQSESHSFSQYIRVIPRFLKNNRNFSWFLGGSVLTIFGGMAVNFYILHARYAFQTTDGFAASLTMAALISQSVGTPLLGWMSDRMGHKWLYELSILLGAASLILMLLIQAQILLYPAFILMNLSIAGLHISRASITMEFGGLDQLPTYTALAGTLLGVPTLAAPVVGGWVLDQFGYTTLYAVALALTLAGWAVIRLRVRDPRIHKTRQ